MKSKEEFEKILDDLTKDYIAWLVARFPDKEPPHYEVARQVMIECMLEDVKLEAGVDSDGDGVVPSTQPGGKPGNKGGTTIDNTTDSQGLESRN